MKSIAMVAGETSGDMLGGHLLAALRSRVPDARMYGIGGPRMMAHGFVSDWPMEALSVNGLFEVLKHYREIKGIRDGLLQQLLQEKPDVFVGIDAPEFNLGLELRLKQAGIPTLHLVGPSVWAWRKGRLKTIAKAVSRILVLFPFEEAIYREAGIPVRFVGHPLAEVIPMQPDQVAARHRLGIPESAKVVAILPGSRMSELRRHTVTFIGAAHILAERDPSIRFVVPLADAAKQQNYFENLIHEAGLLDVPLQIVDGQSHDVMAAADTVLVASGTATLEVALHKKPMVIAYKLMWATWQIARHLVTPPVGLPNILARERIVPELLQEEARPEALAEALWQQLNDEAYCTRLRDRLTDMHHSLLRNMAEECAQAVLEVMEQKK